VNTNMLSGLTTGNILHAEIVQRGVHYHGTHSTVRVPAQLMPASRHFVDRQAARPPGVSAVVVQDGAGGVGKTVLAQTCLHSKADRFPDVLLYADFGATGTGPKLPHTALGRFLRDLGVPQAVPGGLQERTALYRTVTASGALGILLDDAQCAEHVLALLLASANTLALVTSRRPLLHLLADGAHLLRLPPRAPPAGLPRPAFGRSADPESTLKTRSRRHVVAARPGTGWPERLRVTEVTPARGCSDEMSGRRLAGRIVTWPRGPGW
jgi:hypothetical protein